MKRHIAFLLTMTAFISIAGCGSGSSANISSSPNTESSISVATEPSVAEQMYEKYGSIITKLEGENYDGAIEEIEAMKPASVVQEVEITPDNFYDYYDIIYRENDISRDSDGRITRIYKWDNEFSFVLKDEYKLDENEDNTILVGVTGDYDLKKIEDVDFETGEITLGDEVFDEYKAEIVESNKEWANAGSALLSVTSEGTDVIYCNASLVVDERWNNEGYGWISNLDISPTDYEGYVFAPVNIEISRAEGTLHIVNE